MKLVWLSVNASYSHRSLALPLLHAACEQAGVAADWRVVETTPNDALLPVVVEILAQPPDVLLATCYLFTVETVLAVCRRLKAVAPATLVILGGPEFLGDNHAFLNREPWVDAVLRGEGELALPALLGRLQGGTPWRELPGLCGRQPDGSQFDNGMAALPAAAAIPSPVGQPFFACDRPFVALESSRGCPSRCAFCTSAGVAVRDLPIDRLRGELATVRAAGIHEIRLLDRTFNANPNRCLALLELFRRDFADLRFHLEIHPGFLTVAVRQALAAAPLGQLHLEAGLQTTAATALQASGRSRDAQAAWDGLQFLCGAGNLAIHVDLLAGLPGQTLDQVLDDVAALIELGPPEIQLETLKVLPGTTMQAEAGRLGLHYAPTPPYEVLATDTMTSGDLLQASRLGRLVDRFHNVDLMREAVRDAARQLGGHCFLRRLLAFLQQSSHFDQPAALTSRLRSFHAFAILEGLSTTADILAYEWLKAGLSPQAGLVPATLWKDDLPSQAELIDGHPPVAPARCWQACIGGRQLLFAFDRQSADRQAVAVLNLPVTRGGKKSI